jgi:hypothetical protein
VQADASRAFVRVDHNFVNSRPLACLGFQSVILLFDCEGTKQSEMQLFPPDIKILYNIERRKLSACVYIALYALV